MLIFIAIRIKEYVVNKSKIKYCETCLSSCKESCPYVQVKQPWLAPRGGHFPSALWCLWASHSHSLDCFLDQHQLLEDCNGSHTSASHDVAGFLEKTHFCTLKLNHEYHQTACGNASCDLHYFYLDTRKTESVCVCVCVCGGGCSVAPCGLELVITVYFCFSSLSFS